MNHAEYMRRYRARKRAGEPSPKVGRPLEDLSGRRFGRLIAIERVIRAGDERTLWYCRCRCDGTNVVSASDLKRGTTQSCGCLAKEVSRAHLKLAHRKRWNTHGRSRTPEYFAWSQMRARCRDKNHQAYGWYGGRGIRVCDAWNRSFAAFLRDMGERPTPRHSLDRVDMNGPYSPENCRWADWTTQQNNRRSNRLVCFRGEARTIANWARVVGIEKGALYARLGRGWSLGKALTEPVPKQLKL